MNPSPKLANKEPDQQSKMPRKKRRSKLDPFTTELLQMDRDKVTIAEMVDWLGKRDISTAPASLSEFLQSRREQQSLKLLPQKLDSRGEKLKVIRKWLASHTKPDLETLMEHLKMLIVDLGTEEALDPELVKLADKLAQTAIRFENDKSRATYRAHKLIMEREKHLEWVKCEQTRAMELCLDEAKKHPAVADMYRAAFDALREVTLKDDSATLREKDAKTDLPTTIPA
jgi:hypothetical protein